MNTIKLVIFFMFICILIWSCSALRCLAGIDGHGHAALRKVKFPLNFQCCYKYADVNFPRFTIFGAVPPSFTQRACSQAGQCFFAKEVNKNVCVCATADDPNCQLGPIKMTGQNTFNSP